MKLSVTECMTFQRCKRQWDYTSFSRQSLGVIVPNTALSLGKVLHKAWAQWLIEPDARFNELFLSAAIEELDTIKASYLRQIKAPISDAELGPYHDGCEMGLAISKNYQEKWGTPLPAGFSLIAPEQQIDIPIPDAISNGEQHVLSARLDAIIRRESTGDLYILEHKTYASRPKLEILQAAFQFVAYEWAVTQLDIGRVAGTAYDGAWKRKVPPRGSTFDDLFTRLLINHPQEQLNDVQDTLTSIALDMASNPRIYPNSPWTGCLYDCAFNELCTAQSRGEDVSWIKSSRYQRLDADKEPTEDE